MARLFLALTLPEKLQRRLGEEADRLRLSGAHVRWVSPDLYHVTLRFLGEVSDSELPDLDDVLDQAVPGVGSLKLVAKGLGATPSLDRPRVITCGIVGRDEAEQEELLELNQRIEKGLVELGYRREKRRFRPHLTLGRVRGDENLDSLTERIGPTVRREFGHFECHEVTLFESVV